LEVTFGEVMTGGEPPLLKKRRELTREQAIKLWTQKRHKGWQSCAPQWVPPATVAGLIRIEPMEPHAVLSQRKSR
jgi:hypothetical protein